MLTEIKINCPLPKKLAYLCFLEESIRIISYSLLAEVFLSLHFSGDFQMFLATEFFFFQLKSRTTPSHTAAKSYVWPLE